jgi:alcohol dehydrogenase
LSHPVGSVYDTHHGLTNGVFMPYVMNFNQSAIKDRMDLLARYLGLPGTGYSAIMDWVLELRHTFNIANTPHELGVEESRLNELSEMAANDPTAGGNPIPVGAADMKVMYEAAMAGKL